MTGVVNSFKTLILSSLPWCLKKSEEVAAIRERIQTYLKMKEVDRVSLEEEIERHLISGLHELTLRKSKA